MCFSVSASFGAGVILSAIGIASIKKVQSTSQFFCLYSIIICCTTNHGSVSVEINVHKIPEKDKLAPSVIILGQKDAFNTRDNFSDNMINNPAKEIELLLRKQIDKTPETVEFPIQIIQIKNDGVVNIPNIYS